MFMSTRLFSNVRKYAALYHAFSSGFFADHSDSASHVTQCQKYSEYKGSGRGGLSAPPSSVVGNALVVIDDGIESANVKNVTKGHASQHEGQTVNRKMVFGGNLYMVE